MRILRGYDRDWIRLGQNVALHLPTSGDAAPCVGTWRRRCTSRLHRQCQMVLRETARVLGGDESGPSGYHDCAQSIRVPGRLVEWTAEGITWEADPRHAELIRKSFSVTGRSDTTPGVRDKLNDIEGEARSTRRPLIAVVQIRCVRSISPVTDPRYQSSVETWRASCNSHRTWTK